jgi:hypothetical protein
MSPSWNRGKRGTHEAWDIYSEQDNFIASDYDTVTDSRPRRPDASSFCYQQEDQGYPFLYAELGHISNSSTTKVSRHTM